MALFTILRDAFANNPHVGLGTIAVTVVAVMIFVAVRTMPLVPFLYADARVAARSSRLLSKDQLERLSSMRNYGELATALERSDYGDAIPKTVPDVGGLSEMHTKLEQWYVEEIKTVKNFVTPKLWPIFDVYTMFWEARIITAFYRARLADRELRRELVYPVGEMTEPILEKLHSAKTIQDLAAVLAQTRYEEVFQEDFTDVLKLEVALDQFILKQFGELCKSSKLYDGEFLIQMLQSRLDIISIVNALKQGIIAADALVIETHTDVYKVLKDYVPDEDSDHIKDLVKRLEKTKYGSALKRAYSMYEEDGHYYHFETEVMREYLSMVKKEELLHYQGPFPVYAYLMKRELEMSNLRVISKGVVQNYDSEEIKEMMVI